MAKLEKNQCPFCEKKFWNSVLLQHVLKEHKDRLPEYLSKKRGTIEWHKLENNISDEIINEIVLMYETYSVQDVANKYNLPYSTILKLLRLKKVHIRTQRESRIISTPKIESTNIEKYGCKNPLGRGTEPKKKAANTMLEIYGVDNYRKYKPFYIWLDDFMIKNYGSRRITAEDQSEKIRKYKEYWKNLDPIKKDEIIRKHVAALLNGYREGSKLELTISEILDIMKIEYTRQFTLGKKVYDFKIQDILLEVHGDFWHSNPKIYTDNDIMNFPGNKKCLAKEVWKKDEYKKKLANDNGYTYVCIWESEIKNKSRNELINLILERINENYIG